jgi:hypothetical protein
LRLTSGFVFILVLLAGCRPPAESENATNEKPEPTPVEWGKYLTMVAGCHDCHTPKKIAPNGQPEPDMTMELAGHPAGGKLKAVPAGLVGPDGYRAVANNHFTAWVGPWGVSFAMNLTPDEATGLGSWTEKMFIDAIRNGKHQGTGRPILPPMPWSAYMNMTDDDLKAVFAYLQSLPPINNPVPEPLPPDKVLR